MYPPDEVVVSPHPAVRVALTAISSGPRPADFPIEVVGKTASKSL
jgi:hypothetical protein